MFNTSGKEELETDNRIAQYLAALQEKTAFLPDYGFSVKEELGESITGEKGGTTVSGLVGGIVTLSIAGIIGLGLRLVKKYA